MQTIWTSEHPARPAALMNAETASIPEDDQEISPVFGRGIERLSSNYQSIIRARALYYPVSYHFIRELGRGRQGIVFLAQRQGSRGCFTRHAVKLFDPTIYRTAKRYWTDMGRIANQITRLQSLNSPHLVGRDIYEEASGIGYVQMEAIQGLDVHALLYGNHFEVVRQKASKEDWARFSDVIFRFEENRVRIQPGIALYIMRQVLRGLEALHNSGFVHCDVKPANIMCNQLGIAKLVDYGRATLLDERITFLLGSPAFMAPEVHRRETYRVQSDIYSLGLVGIEMLRGEPLMDSSRASEAELLAFKMTLPRRLPDLLPRHVRENKDFVALLGKLVHPDPAQRFESAEQAASGSGGLA
ncbi:MAG: serine/threonine-protein kinase, partial [Kiritimatiellia bacterium]|nr:serine/threonine-protein kinase [Kiritimatiellia bacterium]